jgi:23S rRNA (uracil1939-C5)-methyltransferase
VRAGAGEGEAVGVGQVARVEIHGIAAGGAGVGRLPNGRVVFVHRTAPGEEVEIRILEVKRRWARGEVVRLLRESEDRRVAPCPHYDRCGGCTLEHLRYEAQLRAKQAIVVESLRRIGGVAIEPSGSEASWGESPEVVPSPLEFHYRNRVSFTLRRPGGDRVVAGFHEVNHPGRIVDISGACMLPEPAIAAAWSRLREEWGAGAYRLPSGRELRLTLRASVAGEVALIIEGGYTEGRPEELLERVPELSSIWHRPSGRKDRHELLAGSQIIEESWADEEVGLSGGLFLQVNRRAAALLEAYLIEVVGAVGGRRIVDAYCGVGSLARRFAREGASVVGIELDEVAIEEARRDAPAGAEFVADRVEAALPAALPADLVILNPPRTGLDPAVPEALLARPPARLIYVSCDPATLARDLGRLGPTFQVRSLRSFDLFPQTAHVETVVELQCNTTRDSVSGS